MAKKAKGEKIKDDVALLKKSLKKERSKKKKSAAQWYGNIASYNKYCKFLSSFSISINFPLFLYTEKSLFLKNLIVTCNIYITIYFIQSFF
jgi:hypothetical protein